MTPEGKVKAWVNDTLKMLAVHIDAPVYSFNVVASGYGESGVPDKIACIRGRMFAIEVKAEKPKATAMQMNHLVRAAQAGAVSLVVGGKQFVMVLPDGATSPPTDNTHLFNFLSAAVQ